MGGAKGKGKDGGKGAKGSGKGKGSGGKSGDAKPTKVSTDKPGKGGKPSQGQSTKGQGTKGQAGKKPNPAAPRPVVNNSAAPAPGPSNPSTGEGWALFAAIEKSRKEAELAGVVSADVPPQVSSPKSAKPPASSTKAKDASSGNTNSKGSGKGRSGKDSKKQSLLEDSNKHEPQKQEQKGASAAARNGKDAKTAEKRSRRNKPPHKMKKTLAAEPVEEAATKTDSATKTDDGSTSELNTKPEEAQQPATAAIGGASGYRYGYANAPSLPPGLGGPPGLPTEQTGPNQPVSSIQQPPGLGDQIENEGNEGHQQIVYSTADLLQVAGSKEANQPVPDLLPFFRKDNPDSELVHGGLPQGGDLAAPQGADARRIKEQLNDERALMQELADEVAELEDSDLYSHNQVGAQQAENYSSYYDAHNNVNQHAAAGGQEAGGQDLNFASSLLASIGAVLPAGEDGGVGNGSNFLGGTGTALDTAALLDPAIVAASGAQQVASSPHHSSDRNRSADNSLSPRGDRPGQEETKNDDGPHAEEEEEVDHTPPIPPPYELQDAPVGSGGYPPMMPKKVVLLPGTKADPIKFANAVYEERYFSCIKEFWDGREAERKERMREDRQEENGEMDRDDEDDDRDDEDDHRDSKTDDVKNKDVDPTNTMVEPVLTSLPSAMSAPNRLMSSKHGSADAAKEGEFRQYTNAIFHYYMRYYKWFLDPQIQIKVMKARKQMAQELGVQPAVSASAAAANRVLPDDDETYDAETRAALAQVARLDLSLSAPGMNINGGIPMAAPAVPHQNPLLGMSAQVNPIAVVQQKGLSPAQVQMMGGLQAVAAWYGGGAMQGKGGPGFGMNGGFGGPGYGGGGQHGYNGHHPQNNFGHHQGGKFGYGYGNGNNRNSKGYGKTNTGAFGGKNNSGKKGKSQQQSNDQQAHPTTREESDASTVLVKGRNKGGKGAAAPATAEESADANNEDTFGESSGNSNEVAKDFGEFGKDTQGVKTGSSME